MVTGTAKGMNPGFQTWQALRQRALLFPALLVFALFFVVPLLGLTVFSFLTGSPVSDSPVSFTLSNYIETFTYPLYRTAMWNTLKLGVITTLASLILGYPVAYHMARTRNQLGRRLMLIAVLAPMLVGMVVRTFSWMTLLGDVGVINQWLLKTGIVDKPLSLMYNEFGIGIALIHIYLPFMILTLSGVISSIDTRLEQAAQNLGATAWYAFWAVTVPLSLPGIIAGSLLVFALTISAYVVPILMGGFQYMTLPILIYQQVAGIFDFAMGSALSVVLLAVSLMILIGYHRLVSKVSKGVYR